MSTQNTVAGTPITKLDVRGARCPMPIVKAKKALDGLARGELLEVSATDPGSVADFQGWVRAQQSRLALRSQVTTTDEQGRTVYVHLIERTA
jgi:TusA-related sulfurtransferase